MQNFDQDYDLESLRLIKPTGHDFKMHVTPRFVDMLVTNPYERFTADIVKRRVKDCTTIIDVGAHYGFFSILSAKSNPNTKVFAFEAVQKNAEIFRKNIKENVLDNVTLIEKAVSDASGWKDFNLTAPSDTGSIVVHPQNESIGLQRVQTISIDEAVSLSKDETVFVKIDVDGHELAVLDGMKKTIQSVDQLTLIIEFNPKCQIAGGNPPERLLRKLDELGFDTYLLDEQRDLSFRLSPEKFSVWTGLMGPKEYRNLLCIRKKRSLSLVFFSHLASLTGAERSLLELTTELVNNYGAVCTVILPGEGPLRERLNNAGVSTVVSEYSWWCGTEGNVTVSDLEERLVSDIPSLLEVCSLVGSINPDVIVTNTTVIPVGLFASVLLQKPHVVFPREPREFVNSMEWLLGKEKTFELLQGQSQRIFCNSAETGMQFKASKRIEVVPTHINVDRLRPSPRIFKKTSSIKLILPGTLAAVKGQTDAIEAAALLSEKGLDVELVIMGGPESEYSDGLRKRAFELGLEENIVFIPFQNEPYSYYTQADIILVCSRGESLGRVAGEALELGVPLVATNIFGLKDFVISDKTALAYTPGDAQALANQIERIVSLPELRASLINNGKEHLKNFTADRFGGKVWQSLLELKSEEDGSGIKSSGDVVELLAKMLAASSKLMQKRSESSEENIKVLQKELLSIQTQAAVMSEQQNALYKRLLLMEQALRDVTSSRTWQYREKALGVPGVKRGWRTVRRIFS